MADENIGSTCTNVVLKQSQRLDQLDDSIRLHMYKCCIETFKYIEINGISQAPHVQMLY